MVQLDSDMLVLKNMDELMDLELDSPDMEGKGNRVFAAGHACVCNPLKKPHYPTDWVPENCAFTTQHSSEKSAKAGREAPPTDASPLGYMNGGLQVVNPSQAVYQQIIEYLNSDKAPSLEFADQSLLSDLFRHRWVPLPYIYNALKTLRWQGVHAEIWKDEEVKNVHYILSPKPWDEDVELSDDREEGGWKGKAKDRSAATDESHRWWQTMNVKRIIEEQGGGEEGGRGWDGF